MRENKWENMVFDTIKRGQVLFYRYRNFNYSNSEKINYFVLWEFFTLVTVKSQLQPTERPKSQM